MTRYLDATLSSVGACMIQRQGVPSNLKLITTTINEECKAGEGINNTLMQVCAQCMLLWNSHYKQPHCVCFLALFVCNCV